MQSTICILPKLKGIGGMVSFQSKFAEGLARRGIEVCYDLNGSRPDAILVIGGTRNLHQLYLAKRRGIRIVQRLDGMNWIHRVLNTGINHWTRAEYGNLILNLIRSNLADRIIYQSQFTKSWWEEKRGQSAALDAVIHNGVDLTKFSPLPGGSNLEDVLNLLLVEGSLLGGYEFGLKNAIQFVSQLALETNHSKRFQLAVVGKVPPPLQTYWDNWVTDNVRRENLQIKWIGVVDHGMIHEVYQQAELLFSADINAACPNSVIESLASGTPVIGFDTGALLELLGDEGGEVVPYGGNPWKIDPPDIKSLAENAKKMLNNLDDYQKTARARAESTFDLEIMVDQYISILLG